MKPASAIFHGIGIFLSFLWIVIVTIDAYEPYNMKTPWLAIVGFILVSTCFLLSLVYDCGYFLGTKEKESQPENEQETDDVDVIPLPGDD